MNDADLLLAELADRLRDRFYGKYRGIVTDVDGDNMRVKAQVPAVLGEEVCGWAMPCVPYAGDQVGLAFLPEKGSGVWIEFEGGDVSFPIWVGCYWRAGERPPEAKPDAKAIVTRTVKLVFDDQNSKATWSDKNENVIRLDSNGIATERGNGKVEVAQSGVKVNGGALEVT